MFAARSMIAHVMFFVGNKEVVWPAEGSSADELYWTYAMARLGAYPSAILDVSKEAGSANSKRSVPYFIGRMRRMRAMNAHRRLCATHHQPLDHPVALRGPCRSSAAHRTARTVHSPRVPPLPSRAASPPTRLRSRRVHSLTAHSGFNWSNACKEAPELCEVMSAQVHFPQHTNNAIPQIEHEYYPFLLKAAAAASTPCTCREASEHCTLLPVAAYTRVQSSSQ
jgi:hypothetical protein